MPLLHLSEYSVLLNRQFFKITRLRYSTKNMIIIPTVTFIFRVKHYRQFSIIPHLIRRYPRHPSLILGNRLNTFHVKVIRSSVTLEFRHFLPKTDGWRIIEYCLYTIITLGLMIKYDNSSSVTVTTYL